MSGHSSDLASILQALSAHTKYPGLHDQTQGPYSRPPAAVPNKELEEGEYSPYDLYQKQVCGNPPIQQTPIIQHPHHAQANPPISAPIIQSTLPKPHQSSKPKPTTYPAALHHILALTQSSPTFLSSIRHLISTQHKHEREWYKGRVALQAQLNARKESRRKLRDVLNSVGASSARTGVNGPGDDDKEEDGNGDDPVKELKAYDRKVYRAQRDMVKGMSAELSELGVPGFGTELSNGTGGKDDEMRKKIISLLEDLCAGDVGS